MFAAVNVQCTCMHHSDLFMLAICVRGSDVMMLAVCMLLRVSVASNYDDRGASNEPHKHCRIGRCHVAPVKTASSIDEPSIANQTKNIQN